MPAERVTLTAVDDKQMSDHVDHLRDLVLMLAGEYREHGAIRIDVFYRIRSLTNAMENLMFSHGRAQS
jgi:hypothetical protein